MAESKVEELKRLIKESEEKIKLNDLKLNDIDKEIKAAKEKMKLNAKKVLGSGFSRILTPKQKEMLEIEKRVALQKIKENERKTIDSQVKAIFDEAQVIRQMALNDSEKKRKEAEKIALNKEIKILKKELIIRREIALEKEKITEELLAQKIAEESKLLKHSEIINLEQNKKLKDEEIIIKRSQNSILFQGGKDFSAEVYLESRACAYNAVGRWIKVERRLGEKYEQLKSFSDV